METKAYLKVPTDYWYNLVPVDKFKWTGRWRIDTIEKSGIHTTTLSVERWVRLFNIIPLWKTWEDENHFIFREEEHFISECAANELKLL